MNDSQMARYESKMGRAGWSTFYEGPGHSHRRFTKDKATELWVKVNGTWTKKS